ELVLREFVWPKWPSPRKPLPSKSTSCKSATPQSAKHRLTREGRPVAELALLGKLLNSRQIDSSGGALPIDPATLEGIWREIRTLSPGAEDTAVQAIAASHEGEAGEAEAAYRWFAAEFHLRRLLELKPQ